MPVTRSAANSLRQDRKRQRDNLRAKNQLRSALRKFPKQPTSPSLTQALSLLDRAAKRHIIHPNKAARLKSQLSHLLHK